MILRNGTVAQIRGPCTLHHHHPRPHHGKPGSDRRQQTKFTTQHRAQNEAGKARAKLNALKDGSHAKTVRPVLPQENAIELDQRINKWINELNPRNDAERELVVEAAELAWTIDRTKRSETARMAERVRQAMLKADATAAQRSGRAGPQAPVQHRGKTLAHARTALGRQPGRISQGA